MFTLSSCKLFSLTYPVFYFFSLILQTFTTDAATRPLCYNKGASSTIDSVFSDFPSLPRSACPVVYVKKPSKFRSVLDQARSSCPLLDIIPHPLPSTTCSAHLFTQ
jgi:hypothetical protein